MSPIALREESEASPAEVALCLSTRKDHSIYTFNQMYTDDPGAVVPAAELPSCTALGQSPETEHIRSAHNNTYVRTKIKVRLLENVCLCYVDLRSSFGSIKQSYSAVVLLCHYLT